MLLLRITSSFYHKFFEQRTKTWKLTCFLTLSYSKLKNHLLTPPFGGLVSEIYYFKNVLEKERIEVLIMEICEQVLP